MTLKNDKTHKKLKNKIITLESSNCSTVTQGLFQYRIDAISWFVQAFKMM